MAARPRTTTGLVVHLLRAKLSRRRSLVFAAGAAVAAITTGGALHLLTTRRDRVRCDEAKRLRGIDCPTPRCTREAHGTGWLVYSESLDRWYVELHCPRCGETFTRSREEWQPMIDRCVEDGRGCRQGATPLRRS